MSFVLHGYQTYTTEAKRDEKRQAVQTYFLSQADADPTACTAPEDFGPAGVNDTVQDGFPGFSICYNFSDGDNVGNAYAGMMNIANPDEDPSETGSFHAGWSGEE